MTTDLIRLGVCIVMVSAMGVLNSRNPYGGGPLGVLYRYFIFLGTLGFLGAATVVAVGLVF